jgi:tetratricopeptide (TPR) repeat protein
MNQGALYWQQSAHEKAIEAYKIAEKYLPNDPLLLRFKGLQYLFSSNLGAAIPILEKVKGATVEGSTYQDTQIEDFLDKKIDIEGLKMLYDKDGIDRSSIKKQIEKMEAKLEQFPEFRDGIFQLAGCWLSLNRTKEAFAVLKKYHQIDPKNPVVEYYLAALALDRLELEEGKLYLKNANELLKKQNFYPECLKELSAAYKKADPSF